jgi:cellulose synthase/poly-beta-1,6-N-acetylglucosamine synthase-like glycosyltransferase
MPEGGVARARVRSAVVVIPVHDEAEELGGSLAAVADAVAAVDVPVRVTVVLDACSDGSATIPGPDVDVTVVDAHNVGAARRAGFLRHRAGADVWFATTDADSRVPRDWLRRHLWLADAGADAVVGTVVARDWAQWPVDAERLFDADYRAQQRRGRHGHIHGANIGVRGAAYAAVGGFAGVRSDEDVALVAALDAAGHSIAWDTEAPVATSTRRVGRAPAGFADALADIIDLPGTA